MSIQKSSTPSTLQTTSSSSHPSSSLPSGQFRVSRKAIPLPKVQTKSTSSKTESDVLVPTNTLADSRLTLATKKDLGKQKSTYKNEEVSQIPHSYIKASDRTPIAGEINTALQQSSNIENSFILPKHLEENSEVSSPSEIVKGSSNPQSLPSNNSQVQNNLDRLSNTLSPIAKEIPSLENNNKDPENLARVKVKFPWLSDDDESHWASIATPMAGVIAQ